MTQKNPPACKPRKVLVFGAFDELHPGHRHFLKRARDYGDQVIVALAQDNVIEKLKSHQPGQSFNERKKALEESGLVHKVYKGDAVLGNYRTLSLDHPDVIALGYDQDQLSADLSKWMQRYHVPLPIVRIESFKPDTYKTSLLRKQTQR